MQTNRQMALSLYSRYKAEVIHRHRESGLLTCSNRVERLTVLLEYIDLEWQATANIAPVPHQATGCTIIQ